MTDYSYDLAGRLLKQCALRQNSIPAREAMEEAAARILALEEALKEVTECFSEDYSIADPRSQAALKLASKMTKPRI